MCNQLWTKNNNQLIGTIGDISFFSFGVFKFISSLNGGMILTKNKNLFNKILDEHKNFKSSDLKMIFKKIILSVCLFLFQQTILFLNISLVL